MRRDCCRESDGHLSAGGRILVMAKGRQAGACAECTRSQRLDAARSHGGKKQSAFVALYVWHFYIGFAPSVFFTTFPGWRTMINLRSLLLSAALAALAGCTSTPVSVEAYRATTPRLDTGQTLGSGHRDGGETTTTTAFPSTVAADSGTTSAFGGQTLGSGH